jgi:hypothetical protein
VVEDNQVGHYYIWAPLYWTKQEGQVLSIMENANKTRQMWWCFFHSMDSIPLFNTQTHTGTHNSMLCGCPHPKPVYSFPVASKYQDFHSCPHLCQCAHYQLQQTIIPTYQDLYPSQSQSFITSTSITIWGPSTF